MYIDLHVHVHIDRPKSLFHISSPHTHTHTRIFRYRYGTRHATLGKNPNIVMAFLGSLFITIKRGHNEGVIIVTVHQSGQYAAFL